MRRAVVVEAQVAVGKNKATSARKATPAIDNWKGKVQREVLDLVQSEVTKAR